MKTLKFTAANMMLVFGVLGHTGSVAAQTNAPNLGNVSNVWSEKFLNPFNVKLNNCGSLRKDGTKRRKMSDKRLKKRGKKVSYSTSTPFLGFIGYTCVIDVPRGAKGVIVRNGRGGSFSVEGRKDGNTTVYNTFVKVGKKSHNLNKADVYTKFIASGTSLHLKKSRYSGKIKANKIILNVENKRKIRITVRARDAWSETDLVRGMFAPIYYEFLK